MFMRKYNIVRIVAGVLVTLAMYGGCGDEASNDDTQPFEAPDPFEQNARLGRGVNLGNALEAPSEGEWGMTLQEAYFQLIASAGFDAVRIPIRWSAHASVDEPYAIDATFFERIDWAIEQALSRSLAVVINIHHYEEIASMPADHKARFLALWQQIAAHYQTHPVELLFEILNEPHDQLTPALWNVYLAEALGVIRQTNPNRTVVVGTANWGGLGALDELAVPEDDQNIIVTFHYYNPFPFTHQGAEWVSGSDSWLGTSWGTPADSQAVVQELAQAAAWGQEHNRPIFMGEFGAYSKADMASRARWTTHVARQAEAHGFGWAYWEFGAGFGIYDRSLGAWNTPLLEALIPPEP